MKSPLPSTDSLEDKAPALDNAWSGPVLGDQSTGSTIASILEQHKEDTLVAGKAVSLGQRTRDRQEEHQTRRFLRYKKLFKKIRKIAVRDRKAVFCHLSRLAVFSGH